MRKLLISKFATSFFALSAFTVPIAAQSEEPALLVGSISKIPQVDISVPKSPAFTVLGLSPQNATNPATITELGAALFNAVDKNGVLQTGFGFDTNPYFVFRGDRISLGDYQTNFTTRLLTNTQISFASAKATGEMDQSAQIALGLHVTPWIKAEHDPRRNAAYINCLVGVLQSLPPPGNVGDPFNDDPAVRSRDDDQAQLVRALGEKGCKERFAPVFSSPSAWTIGLAPSFISQTGEFDDIDWAGLAAWSTLSIRMGPKPFGLESQLIAHGRFRLDEIVADTNVPGNFVEQDSAVGAVRFRLGTPNWNASAEAAAFLVDPEGARHDIYGQATGGLEFKLNDGIWLESEAGRTFDQPGGDSAFANISLKMNFGSQ